MRLDVEELELEAGAFRLGPLSLTVRDGEYLIILGPTGAGKTVTLETIAGLRAPRAGKIAMDGDDMTRAAPESRRVGFLYQDSLLFPHLNVRDNLAYGAHRLPRADRAQTIERIAHLLELEPLLARSPRGLSGGERQRVALGRALATNPALLLLDEPMAALDPNSRASLQRTLRMLHRELGTTTIHVTHSFSEALALGDRITVMIDGRIRQTGAPREVFSRPDSPEIARFLRTASLAADHDPPPDSASTILASEFVLRADADDREGTPVIVAGEVRLLNGTASQRPNAIPARVLAVEREGGSIRLRLNIGVELRASLDGASGDLEVIAEGSAVWVLLGRE